MGVTKQELGRTPNGELVTLYKMTNRNGLTASITDYGAIWQGLTAPDRNGEFEDVVLGYDTPEALYVNAGEMGAVVGRNANRIKNGVFTLNGKRYHLAHNDGENNLHSGPNKFSKRLYHAETNSFDGADEVRLSLQSPEGDQGYPGSMSVEVIYTFTDDNALLIEYHLTAGPEDTIANMTCHPYFNLAGHKSGSALSQEIWIDADSFCEIGPDVCTTGRILSVAGTPFDFRKPKALGKDLDQAAVQLQNGGGYDHNFCLNHKNGRMALSASAYDPKSGRFMEVYTSKPGIQLYSGNFLDPAVAAKDGAHYNRRDGYAFETQFYPNAVNVPEWEQPILKAGKTRYSLTTYKFSVK